VLALGNHTERYPTYPAFQSPCQVASAILTPSVSGGNCSGSEVLVRVHFGRVQERVRPRPPPSTILHLQADE